MTPAHGHRAPSSDDEVPDLCKATFVSKTGLMAAVWIIIGLMTTACGGVLTWAFITQSSIVKLETIATEHDKKLSAINDINTKLDKLVDAKGK